MSRKLIILMMVVFTATTLTFAASKGTSGAQFLKVIAAPRISAMGGTYAAVSGDINSIAANPAGLALLKKKEIALVQNSWIQDISNQYIAVGMPTEKAGTFALGVVLLSAKDITKRDNLGADQGKFDSSDMAITLAYARALGKKMNLGLNLKSISCKIDDASASSIGADIGMLYGASSKLDLGLVVQNLGSEVKFLEEGDPLPMTIKIGGAYKPSDKLLVGLDINSPNDSDMYVSLGGEFCIAGGEKLMFPIRLGYRTGMETGGMSGLNAGLGIMYNSAMGIDVTWTPVGDLGDSIKFGLNLKF